MIQFEDFSFGKVKLKTMLDGVFMSALNFDWLDLHEIMAREVHNIKKEQNQKSNRSQLQTKQQQKLMIVLGSQGTFELIFFVNDPLYYMTFLQKFL